MGVVGGFIVYALLWFVCLILIAPRGQATQLEEGVIEPGTPGGAPATIHMGRKLIYASLLALAIWAVIYGVVAYELVTLSDLEFFSPASLRGDASGS